MTNAKVRIDVPAGIVELEGGENFVATYLDKLLPFIEAGGFGTNPPKDEAIESDSGDEAQEEKEEKEEKKKKRKITRRAPPGSSCRDRILALRKDGFFKEKRSLTQIVSGLGTKGWTHTKQQVGAALTTMFEKHNEIQRTKEGKSFKYFYDYDT